MDFRIKAGVPWLFRVSIITSGPSDLQESIPFSFDG